MLEHIDEEQELAHLVILDQQTFAPKWAHQLNSGELAMSILCAPLGTQLETFIVVGPATINHDEAEPKK